MIVERVVPRRVAELQVGDHVDGYGVLRYVSPHLGGRDVVWVASDDLPGRQPDQWPREAWVRVILSPPRRWQRTITYETDRESVADAWRIQEGQTECASTMGHPSTRMFGDVVEVTS